MVNKNGKQKAYLVNPLILSIGHFPAEDVFYNNTSRVDPPDGIYSGDHAIMPSMKAYELK